MALSLLLNAGCCDQTLDDPEHPHHDNHDHNEDDYSNNAHVSAHGELLRG